MNQQASTGDKECLRSMRTLANAVARYQPETEAHFAALRQEDPATLRAEISRLQKELREAIDNANGAVVPPAHPGTVARQATESPEKSLGEILNIHFDTNSNEDDLEAAIDAVYHAWGRATR